MFHKIYILFVILTCEDMKKSENEYNEVIG